jgi:hypothetical protein
MKRQVLVAAIAVLALAGIASAQSRGGGAFVPGPGGSVVPGGPQTDRQYNLSQPVDFGNPYNPGGPARRGSSKGIVPMSVRNDFRLQCASDRETLCADKKSDVAADRCIRYHRLKLSASCKQALTKVQLAYDGRL